MQTLSRLNRAHPGKDTTYVLDFVNDPEEVLASFKAYSATAELSATSDPNLVFNLRAKLDAAGHYDDFEVDRVVTVELKPDAKQSELVAALVPVQDRLMKRYQAARAALNAAEVRNDAKAAKAAQDEWDAHSLFKSDMGGYLRLYTFLSQIFDYGNSPIEKRAIFYKRLLPLLDANRAACVTPSSERLMNPASRRLPSFCRGPASREAAVVPPKITFGGGTSAPVELDVITSDAVR